MAMSGSTSSGHAPNYRAGVMGHEQRHRAPSAHTGNGVPLFAGVQWSGFWGCNSPIEGVSRDHCGWRVCARSCSAPRRPQAGG